MNRMRNRVLVAGGNGYTEPESHNTSIMHVSKKLTQCPQPHISLASL